MSDLNTSYAIGKYLTKVSTTFANRENKSLSDILESFRLVSNGYQELTEAQDIHKYSDYDYMKLTQEEKQEFFNDQLQFIECLVINNITFKTGVVWNWHDIFSLLLDGTYAMVEKSNRKVVYSTSANNRPIGDVAYSMWNGLQIIDIDTKDADLANKLKPVIFDELKKFHWFLGVCLSASKKSLHVWTKITPISIEAANKRTEYMCNFRHKYSYLYMVLMKYMDALGYTKEKIYTFMDMAMAKPQQGIFISSDRDALMNTNFRDTRLDVNFEPAFDTGIESINWITHPDLKSIFSKLEWFSNDRFTENSNVEVTNISNITDRDMKKSLGRRHYKHAQRWQLANTLTSLYGEDKALSIMVEICQGTDARELAGDVKTAALHNKPISIWAIGELNKQHGFNIQIKGSDTYKEEMQRLDAEFKKDDNVATDPTKILSDKTESVKIHINSKQYLSDVRDDIIANLSHMTLLEAGAGYGKTEMIKALKAKTLLILPFTSTIKAKVEASETTRDWLYYYGNKRPTIQDLLGPNSMSMTIDKFSKLNVYELDAANFEYIVIDESHLLFTSSYRDVMSPCIQRLANCRAKIIMMTGTPTGEMLFFPNIKHIKVVKEDIREKKFTLYMCPTNIEQLLEMCKAMADDVMSGIKILYPTNKGNLYFEQVTGLIQKFLDLKKWPHQLKAFYYKKSNMGDDSMDNININKSIGENDIIFCTTYLSVGVDICDRSRFSVYFNEQWIPQDIEQFANRIRNNDLYIKMFLPKKDTYGMPINYYYTQRLNLDFTENERLFARDCARVLNDMLERNEDESKFNPMMRSMIATKNWLMYDENDCRYYIDETTYKLNVFEERYSEWSKQLEVMLNGIKYYGYLTEIIDKNEEVNDDKREQVEEYMKQCRNIRYNYNTTQTFVFLDHITDDNIDLYRELLKGNYEIFKDDKYKEVRGDNNLYVEDIEILERNTPIVLSLYKFYDCDTIRDIYKFCVDKKQNRINFSKLERIRKFVSIEYNRKKSRLDFPVLKFVREAQAWAKANPVTDENAINTWLANYATRYANSIRDVVIQDVDFLEEMFSLSQELWKVVIVQGRPKQGKIDIKPFELEWDRKDILENIYGNAMTKQFFLQELADGMREDPMENSEPEELPEFKNAEKKTLDDVRDELKYVIHGMYEYDKYSGLDGSNERFLRKQRNTNQLDVAVLNSEAENLPTTTIEPTLFNDEDMFTEIEHNPGSVPF